MEKSRKSEARKLQFQRQSTLQEAPRVSVQKRLTYDSLKADQEQAKAITFEFCDEEAPQEKSEEFQRQDRKI